MMQWFTLIGLAFDLVGAWLAAYHIVSPTDAETLEAGYMRWAPDDFEEGRKLPHIQKAFQQVSYARMGLGLIAFGSFLQLIPAIVVVM